MFLSYEGIQWSSKGINAYIHEFVLLSLQAYFYPGEGITVINADSDLNFGNILSK